MNPIHRFIQIPLWVILLVALFRKPAGVIASHEDYQGYFEMFKLVLRSIRLTGRNRVERWFINRLVIYLDNEMRAISENSFGIIIIQSEATK